VISSSSLQIFNEFQTTQLLDIEGGTHLPRSRAIFLNAQYAYPWDIYFLTTVFIAVNHENNASLPILKLALVDSANDFYPNFGDSATSYFNGTNNISSQTLSLSLTRTPLVKSFDLTIYFVNWLLTGTVLFITIAAFYGKKEMPEVFLLFPVTVILTVPSLRALMVDSPAFGEVSSCWLCTTLIQSEHSITGILIGDLSLIPNMNDSETYNPIDIIGLFPQMIIVSLCSVVLLLHFVHKFGKQ
jgi:hypothetical protein